MIHPVDYLLDGELLILVQKINIRNQQLYIRKDKFVFADLKHAYLKNTISPCVFRTWILKKVQ